MNLCIIVSKLYFCVSANISTLKSQTGHQLFFIICDLCFGLMLMEQNLFYMFAANSSPFS